MYNLLEHYASSSKSPRLTPVAIDVISLDYFLHLYAGEQWYVVVEVDYLSGMPGIAKDIEHSFPVKVTGWCVLKEFQGEAGTDLLPADADDYDPDGTNDANYNNRRWAVYSEFGMKYALLRVEPKPGVGLDDFGLSYFENAD